MLDIFQNQNSMEYGAEAGENRIIKEIVWGDDDDRVNAWATLNMFPSRANSTKMQVYSVFITHTAMFGLIHFCLSCSMLLGIKGTIKPLVQMVNKF